MLPEPFIDFLPVIYRNDAGAQALAEKVDEISQGIKGEIIGLNNLVDPVRMPENVLDRIGKYLNAGIYPSDTVREKRKKIANAVRGHKLRSSFERDAKQRIDAIAGGDSKLIKSIGADTWVLVGDGSTPAGYYWGTMGGDGIDDRLGLQLTGTGEEIGAPDVVWIDVDNTTLTESEQAKIELNMTDITPAYLIVSFGYIDSGQFNKYFTMR